MKKKILILAGGISKERLISLDTGLQVAKELKKNKELIRDEIISLKEKKKRKKHNLQELKLVGVLLKIL